MTEQPEDLGRELARQGACIEAAEKACDRRMGDLEKRIDQRTSDLEKRISQRLASMELAVEKASVGMDKRLDIMNEFRQAINDILQKFPTSEEIRMQLEPIKNQLSQLWDWKNALAGMATAEDVGKAEKVANRALWVAVVLGGLAILSRFVPWGG